MESLGPSKSRRDEALDMLDDLDLRHDTLLSEIDALSARIDGVLGEYTKQRGGPNVITPQTELDADETNDDP